MDNFILATDSYKLTHWKQYPEDTEVVYSYFEARKGAQYPWTVFFGLQYILQKYMEGPVVNHTDIDNAKKIATYHFGDPSMFNEAGWRHIVDDHGGKLPLLIKAVPEGTVVDIDNVMMTVENTCPKCFWLTNAVESMLTHVWYSSTVATKSQTIKMKICERLQACGDSLDALDFMLQDFGYRGATSHEAAAIGGASHLVNFKGTDTLPALLLLHEHYSADWADIGFSVPATEHSVMTARGEKGEYEVLEQLFREYPKSILSVVADSYDIYKFTEMLCGPYKNEILDRDGAFVIRPDSVTGDHPTPSLLTAWIVARLWKAFGGSRTEKGFKVLNPKIRVLWGDGIDADGIDKIMCRLMLDGFSPSCMACFGMGGGLLQKMNRDTQRFAFKCSARKDNKGVWHDVQKSPLDSSKKSKAGRLCLNVDPVTVEFKTVPLDAQTWSRDIMQTVFLNGEVTKRYTLDEVRKNANM